ncbi:MAG: response regulator [candidate division Zixibacteria bacterium]|nr:response regulator [candidate division Zixibacteria bacterium]
MNNSVILVIDDDLMIRDLLYDFLLERGYSVIAAADGTSANEAIENRKFDAAIIDVKLPESDGLTIVRNLRAKLPDTPVIVITAYPTDEIKDEALNLGATAFLEKPFKVTRIAAILKNAISTKETVEIENSHVV